MRTTVLICLFAAALAAIAGCGCSKKAETGGPAQVTIGFLVKKPDEAWFQSEWAHAAQAAKDHGFQLMQIGTPTGEDVLNAIDRLAVKQAKGLVICTPDVRLGPAIMQRAAKHGIKVARRTVTKYRKAMNIPSSRERRDWTQAQSQ